jgi:hypothetical protein
VRERQRHWPRLEVERRLPQHQWQQVEEAVEQLQQFLC